MDLKHIDELALRVCEHLRKGEAITPFVGSGISASSGILTGQEFDNFLIHTAILVLSENWDVRKVGWPNYPTSKNCAKFKERVKDIEQKHIGRKSVTDLVISEGVRMIRGMMRDAAKPRTAEHVEWTDLLRYLSQVCWAEGKLVLTASSAHVIDSYNAHITRGKRPNLNHSMLARLTRTFRSHTVLTTNFDTLLEQSFIDLNRQFQVFAVSAKGQLPHFSTVRAQDSLIKLHGDILETRADEMRWLAQTEPAVKVDEGRDSRKVGNRT